MGTGKVFSGSQDGKVQYPYDAMVYIDGTSVIAVDSEGNTIKRGVAGTDDAAVIQAAINVVEASGGGEVRVEYGTYTISSMITIGVNVKLDFDYNTIVKPATDINMFYVKNSSRISGCKIDVSAVAYASSCILVDGVEKFSAADYANGVQIENVWFYNDEYTGTAIYFKSTESGGSTGRIYGVIVDKVRIRRFDYGIRMYRTGAYATNWINGNKFSNIRAITTRKLIYMETDTGTGSDFDGNIFDSIDIQSGGTPSPSIPCIVIRGRYNVITNCMIWDWNVVWGPMFEFAANSNLNYVELDTSGSAKYVNNGATSNTAFFTQSAEFTGLPKAPTAAYGTNTTQIATTAYVMDRVSPIVVTVGASNCDYTTLSAALNAITDASATKRYCIQVCGYVVDDATCNFKSYVDVVGIGNACVEIIASGNLYFNILNKENIRIQNLTLKRSGTHTSGVNALAINNSKNVTLDHVTVINDISSDVANLNGAYIQQATGLLINGCTFYSGGKSGTVSTGYGMYAIISSEGIIRDSVFIAGTGTSSAAAYFSDTTAFDISNCVFRYNQFNSSFGYTGGGYSFVPSSVYPLCLEPAHIIYISVAGGAGSTISIGTTDGGTEIGSISSTSTGYKKAIPYNLVSLPVGGTIYVKPSDPNTRFVYYYHVGYNTQANALCLAYTAACVIRNCSILSNGVSSALYIYDNNTLTRLIDCYIYSRGLYDAEFSSGDTRTLYAYGCTFGSGRFMRVNALPENSGNSGISIPSIGTVKETASYIGELMGSPKLVVPFSDRSLSTVTDYTRHNNSLTASTTISGTWIGIEGYSSYYNFNGSSHYLYRTNDTDFDFGNSTTDSAFSVVVAINPDSVTSRFLVGKWDANNAREWRLFLDASGYLTLQLYDESVDKYIGRQDQTALTTGSWKILVATYDGSGICAGCKIYIDGVQLDDADYTNAGYVAMEAVSANLMVGALKNGAAYSEYYDGKMTWIGIAAKELSADEVWSLTQRLKGVLGI